MHRVFVVIAGYDYQYPEFIQVFKKQGDADRFLKEKREQEGKYWDYGFIQIQEV